MIRFLCTNEFLVGVEGKVGELEEEERRGVKELGVQSKAGEEERKEAVVGGGEGMEVDGEGEDGM